MDPDPAGNLLRQGSDALVTADWETARVCFEQALAEEQSPEALDGLGRALHFLGRYEEAIELTERACVAYGDAGRSVDAADCARWLAFLHGTINGNFAVAGGWMGRAKTLLDDVEECAGHGWLLLDHAPLSDDVAERERLAVSALAIARRFGDRPLEYDAMALLGESRVLSGRVAEGMQMLDEAMTAVASGEVGDIVAVADILCRLFSACETARDIVRAEQWMSVGGAFESWSEWVSPVCRTHYGGILIAAGRWTEAEEHLAAAAGVFERSYRAMRGFALVKLADLRVRQGRLEEARRLLEDNEHQPLARRALATIALVNGDVALAEDMARLCLDAQGPPDPACATALELLVQIRLARGDLAGARAALGDVVDLAAGSDDGSTAALAELAAGRVQAADGGDAAPVLQSALQRFADLDLPYEAARCRLALAGAIAEDAPAGAAAEARAALDAFERMGAAHDADSAAALLRELGSGGRAWPKRYGPLTKRESEVLSLLAAGCSNADIASRLVISRRTAEHHVASILSKLDLKSRSEAAAYAVRTASEDT